MHISSLKIERFGAWADLRLNGFSEGLNVIYGPNGSGKTTVVRFIGATLYGFGDDARSRYLSTGVNGGGSLTVQGPFGRRTILRHDEGPLGDRLIIENADAAVGGLHQLQDLLGGVRQAAFERLFHVEFEGDVDADKLIQSALAEGFDLLGGHADSERVAELQDRLQSKRQALAEITTADIAFDELVRRRRSLQQEIESLQVSFQDRRASWERRLRQLDENIADLQEQLEGLESELNSVTAQIEARQADKHSREAALRDAQQRQFQLESQRRDTLRQIDAQVERWRLVLRDLEDRSRQLRDRAGFGPNLDARAEADPRRHLRRLEDGLDRLQRSVADLTAAAEGGRCQCSELRPALQSALSAIREDLYRLCNGLSDWELRSQQRDNHSELGQLQRCEGELRSALAGLSLQRHALLADLEATQDAERVARHPDHAGLCHCQGHPQPLDAVPQPADEILRDETLLAWELELRRLIARRDQVREDLEMLEEELRDLRDQRRQVALECDPEFEDHQLKAKRQELDGIEVGLRQFERRRELMPAITRLEDELRVLTSQVRTPAILLEASDLLRRLTGGDLQRLTVNADRSLWVDNRRGERLGYGQLSSGGRDQAYLSLSLAVVAAYARRGTRLPLMINDAFGNIDAQGVAAAATVLYEFCRHGHQVLLFTRHQYVADRFRSLDVPVRQLPPLDQPRAAAPAEDAAAVSSLNEINRQLNAIADEMAAAPKVPARPAWSSEEFPGELTDRVRATPVEPSREVKAFDTESAAEYFLLESSPIQEAPSIDSATAERFRKIGVLLAGDLLRLDVAEAAGRLRYAGITAPMIRRWQAESLLVCRIPRLRPYDARILVACGITAPEQLAQMEAEELLRRVEHFATTSTGDVLLRAGNRYELSRLTEWIRAARRDRQRSRAAGEVLPRPQRDDDRRTRSPAARAPHEDRRRPAAAERAGRHEAPQPVVLKMETSAAPKRFHLELSNTIEQAPSIGPRMAERLEAIGIRTVADFLNADPAATAARLNRKSIDADVIRTWQQQAALVCRVPWLRGHDAQILVACGVTDPETLAKRDAATFWKTVQPFAESAQGKRILRTSKAPDLEEVTQWIQWAAQARTLRAA